MPRRLLVTLFAVAMLSLFSGASRADARRATTTGLAPIAYGRPAPNFSFDEPGDRPGTAASLAALRGRPIVVNFWAAYCAPCIDELDVFARLSKAYGPDVAFVAISDQGHDITDGDLRAKGIEAISVADPARKIFELYGVEPIPVTLVLAPDETVRYVSVGELDWKELSAAVDAVRPAEEPAPAPSAAGPAA